MGVSIAVLIVDWEHIESVPDNLRYELLADAAFPDDGEEWPPPLAAEPDNRRNEASRDTALTHGDGWTWPTATEPCWCGVYEFRGTLGSYKAHF
ncbi:hypothetical protein [Streptomyces sp. NPDC052179]|uniref:hypothetical protein n=1 Tax=Streptomyces sp. NPDC052179 TaxID=3155680 RepID=UPI00343772BD